MFLEKDQGNPGWNAEAKNSSVGPEEEIKIHEFSWVIYGCLLHCQPYFVAISASAPFILAQTPDVIVVLYCDHLLQQLIFQRW